MINQPKPNIDKTIAITILARDCEDALMHNIPKIEKLRKCFKSSIVIIVENDSKDKTKELLVEWQNNSENVVVISEDYNIQTIPLQTEDCKMPGSSIHRNERMCFYRNKYMEYLSALHFEYDYMIVVDIDIDDFREEGILQAIVNAPNDWAALFANGRFYIKVFQKRILSRYYDWYAFLPDTNPLETTDMDLTLREMRLNSDIPNTELKKIKYLSCYSAFAGIGIYHYPAIKNLRYQVIPNKRSKYCESIADHIYFNISVINGNSKKNYIASDILVFYEETSIFRWMIGIFFTAKFIVSVMEFFTGKRYKE